MCSGGSGWGPFFHLPKGSCFCWCCCIYAFRLHEQSVGHWAGWIFSSGMQCSSSPCPSAKESAFSPLPAFFSPSSFPPAVSIFFTSSICLPSALPLPLSPDSLISSHQGGPQYKIGFHFTAHLVGFFIHTKMPLWHLPFILVYSLLLQQGVIVPTE